MAAILEKLGWPPSEVKSRLPPDLKLNLSVCTEDLMLSSQSAQFFYYN